MRSMMSKAAVAVALLGLALVLDRATSVVCADAANAATAGEGETPAHKPPRQLSDEQLQQLKERIQQGRRGGGGGAGAGAGGQLDPAKASLDAIKAIYDRGEETFKAENYAAAYECFVDVAACQRVQGAAVHADKARGRLLEMERAAADKLEEAKLARLQGRGAEALDVLRLLLKKYPYCKAADGANDLLVTMSADPKVAAEVALLKAEELDKAAKYPEAAAAYAEIIRKYPDTVQAVKAKLRLKAMNEDEAIAAALKDGLKNAAESECPKLLIMARNYTANKLFAQARGLYEKIVQKYPESDYAKEAKQALEELKASDAVKTPETSREGAAG